VKLQTQPVVGSRKHFMPSRSKSAWVPRKSLKMTGGVVDGPEDAAAFLGLRSNTLRSRLK